MKIKNIAASAAMAGALGLGALAIGGGVAQADPHPWPPIPPVPGPPGQNPWGPPGQVKKDPVIGGVWNPLYGVPPGHWDDPAYFGLPTVWLPPGVPGLVDPLRVVFNPDFPSWGVWVNPDLFIPLPQG